MMQAGRILYAVHEGTYVLKLEGEVRVPLCASLDVFLERMFMDDHLQGVFIDLSSSSMIDSTTLGLLAKISVFLQKHHKDKAVIFSTQPDVTRVLRSMGFEQVFNLLEKVAANVGQGLSEVPEVSTSESEMMIKVIDAHRTLMALNEQNVKTFSNLVETLEQGHGPCHQDE